MNISNTRIWLYFPLSNEILRLINLSLNTFIYIYIQIDCLNKFVVIAIKSTGGTIKINNSIESSKKFFLHRPQLIIQSTHMKTSGFYGRCMRLLVQRDLMVYIGVRAIFAHCYYYCKLRAFGHNSKNYWSKMKLY